MKVKKNYYEMKKQAFEAITRRVKEEGKVERTLIYLMVAEQFGITNKRFVDEYIWLKVKAGFFNANKDYVMWYK